MTDDDLTDMLVAAVRSSLRSITDAHPGEHLSGFALCTPEDGGQVVAPIGTTTEWCSSSASYPEARYIAVEWPYDEGYAAFEAPNVELSRRQDADMRQWLNDGEQQGVAGDREPQPNFERSFECMVRSLERVKHDDRLPDDLLLIVTSVDPDTDMEQLANDAVRRLNTAQLHEAWRRANIG